MKINVPNFSERQDWANSADLDQWSESPVFASPVTSFGDIASLEAVSLK